MKKYIYLTLLLMFCALTAHASPITIDQFISADDVTIAHIEQLRTAVVNGINNADGNLLQYRTVSEDKLTLNADPVTRWRETFNSYTYSGLLPATSASLVGNITSGVGYVDGYRVVKDTLTGHTYTATKYTYVDLKSDGTYVFTEVTPDSAPAIATASMRLAKVETDSDNIVAVTDLRVLSVTLENRQADYYRKGMYMRGSNATTDAVQIMPGVCYWGNIRIAKTTVTDLSLSAGGDWASGAKNNATMGFVIVNNAGTIKLTTTAPAYTDLSGNTIGPKYYTKIGSDYYRVLAWFYMNGNAAAPGTAGSDISPWEWGNFQWDMPSVHTRRISYDTTTTSTAFVDLPDSTMTVYVPAGKGISVKGIMTGYSSQQHYAFNGALKLDGALLQSTEVATTATTTTDPNNGGGNLTTLFVTPELEPGSHSVSLMFRSSYTGHVAWANMYIDIK